ncbi:MAG: TIGR03960 family B12-binding radical SAM protein [Myxococcales bacterium]|jgi:radical SAM family uncharacterized protein/radical SAM-linked protein
MSDGAQEHPYADFLRDVQKPSRYLGGEHGEVRKDWDAVGARLCLAFPDVYEVGMSHLGFKILYSQVNGEADLLAERAYAPWHDMEGQLRQRGEGLRSLESFRPLRDFDVVGFSLQFELTYTTVLQMLDLGGIPLRAEDRSDADPLVLAGGPSSTHAEPLADFIDAFLIGDGEERTAQIMRAWSEARDAGLPRRARLERLAALGGLYVPSLYETELDPDTGMRHVARPLSEHAPLPVKRAFVEKLEDYPFPKDGPIANTETVFDRISVEIARGCTEGCRFCQAGMIYRPVREREPAEVLDVIDHAVRHGGYDGASLTCLSTADYSAISPLIHTLSKKLQDRRATLSVASLRAYGLDEDVLDELRDTGGKGLTFAPEAGSQRMRDVVNKNVTEEQLMETARRVFSRGWSRMKLYFMIALPTEEDEDVRGIVQTGARAQAIGRRLAGRGAQVTVNVSSFVPKPHTPFQWSAMNSREEVLRKQALLREEAKRTGVKLRLHDSAGSWIEGVLARGDRTLGKVIESAYRRGARFDSWDESLDLDAWKSAFEEHGIDPQTFLGTIPVDARLPWDHIDVGLDDGFLAREYRKALKNRLSPPCGKAVGMFVHHTNVQDHEADQRKLVCYHCGVACDMTQMRERRGELLVQLGATKPRTTTKLTQHAQEQSDDPAGSGAPGGFAARGEGSREPSPGRATRDKKGRRKPPVREDQGEAVRVRLKFEKLGRAAFGSHLDLVRMVPRLLRRLELPVYYSKGFSPKPVMSFGPALSLGVLSLAEYVDLKLVAGDHDWASLPARMSETAIDGVRFVQAVPLGAGDPKLNRLIDEAVYVAGLPAAALQQLGAPDAQALQALLDAHRATDDLVVRRDIDGVGKRVDVGRYLLDARAGQGAETLRRAGLLGDLVPITIRMQITGAGTAKASEAFQVLLGGEHVPSRIVREALLCTAGGIRVEPTELAPIRAAFAPTRERSEPPDASATA